MFLSSLIEGFSLIFPSHSKFSLPFWTCSIQGASAMYHVHRIWYDDRYDIITKLFNRWKIIDRLKTAHVSRRQRDTTIGVVLNNIILYLYFDTFTIFYQSSISKPWPW